MSRAIDILMDRLEAGGSSAEKAASSLENQARRQGSAMDNYVPRLAKCLQSSDFGVRAAVASALGEIGTAKASNALLKALETASPSELQTECGYSCWSDEPLYYWLVSRLAKPQDKHVAKLLVSIIASDNYPAPVRACAMGQLSYDLDLEDYGLSLPDNLMDVLEDFSASDDEDVSEGAIRLLGMM